ncbi:wound-induced protein 1 [Phtheirospermum japonicum]|uniref:Wound-induced protein 1 n=1 Tax=Phtheirospermum japonicum TaxID=374723 RepID=A0A830BS74_9LAMI|nr:wound-induced protein 1 [Phtheirospermum japonicum]
MEETLNEGVVRALYAALNRRDAQAIQKILAGDDLEWWFHGPPSHQFLMRFLTGEQDSTFRFVPHSIAAFGPTVLAEGFDQSRSIAWVHAWTVADGIITQVREYFNTSVTVTRIGKTDQSDCSSIVSRLSYHSIWESSLPGRGGKSVPGLVLAI